MKHHVLMNVVAGEVDTLIDELLDVGRDDLGVWRCTVERHVSPPQVLRIAQAKFTWCMSDAGGAVRDRGWSNR